MEVQPTVEMLLFALASLIPSGSGVSAIFEEYHINGRKAAERVPSALDHLREFFGRMRSIDITRDRATMAESDGAVSRR